MDDLSSYILRGLYNLDSKPSVAYTIRRYFLSVCALCSHLRTMSLGVRRRSVSITPSDRFLWLVVLRAHCRAPLLNPRRSRSVPQLALSPSSCSSWWLAEWLDGTPTAIPSVERMIKFPESRRQREQPRLGEGTAVHESGTDPSLPLASYFFWVKFLNRSLPQFPSCEPGCW